MVIRKLIFYGSNVEKRIEQIDIKVPQGMLKIDYIKSVLIKEINKYNKNLDLSSIEFQNSSIDCGIADANYISEIVEEKIIFYKKDIPNNISFKEPNADTWYFSDSQGNLTERRRIAYVYTSPTQIKSRNAFGTQDLFPTLYHFIQEFIDSPSFTYVNHPIYYFNLLTDNKLPYSIIQTLYFISVLKDVHLINIVDPGVTFSSPKNVNQFLIDLAMIAKQPNIRARNSNNKYEDLVKNSNHEFDFTSKKYTIKTELFTIDYNNIGSKKAKHGKGIKDESQNGNIKISFNGSYEKFYSLEILALFELAMLNDFAIDYTQLQTFITTSNQKNVFSGEKLENIKTLLKYIKKRTDKK